MLRERERSQQPRIRLLNTHCLTKPVHALPACTGRFSKAGVEKSACASRGVSSAHGLQPASKVKMAKSYLVFGSVVGFGVTGTLHGATMCLGLARGV